MKTPTAYLPGSSSLVRPGKLTSARGEKISAVEGLKLSPRMQGILKNAETDGLNGDQKRALVRQAFASVKTR